MSRSYWRRHTPALIPLIMLGVLAVLAMYPVDRQPAQSNSYEHQTQGAEPSSGAISHDFLNRDSGADGATRDDPDREIESARRFRWFGDTYAQWIMAIGTIATVALVAWTVVVTRGMLKEAKDATEAAVKASNAARETVEVTRETGIAQIRAYMVVDSENIDWWFSEDRKITFRLIFRNAGQSPAFGVISKGNIVEGRPSFFENASHPAPEEGAVGSPIGPGMYHSHTYTTPTSVSQDRLTRLKTGEEVIGVIGTVNYRDFIGTLRFLRFKFSMRFEVRGPNQIGGYIQATNDGNEAN